MCQTSKRHEIVIFLCGIVGAFCVVSAAQAQIGACCLGDATCVTSDNSGCSGFDGEFVGAGTDCGSVVCEGACCSNDGSKGCFETSSDGCVGVGDFQGAQTTCDETCAALLGTSFSYQGQLKQDGLPMNNMVDLEFSLHPALVTVDQIGTDFRINAVEVVNGLFNIQVDFGVDAFAGSVRWLEVRVRTPHDPDDLAPFITLDPRQEISLTPYASYAKTAESALSSQRPFREDGANAIFEGDNVGIGTDQPTAPLHISGSRSPALKAESDGIGATAIFGTVRAETGIGTGVLGRTFSDFGTGLKGEANSLTGSPTGISGSVRSPEDARAVTALSLAITGNSRAVFGKNNSPDGYAGYFEGGRNYFEGNVGIGEPNPNSDLHVHGDRGLIVEDTNGAPILYAKGTGNVGIGTATPTAKLNVESDANLIQGPVMQSDDIIVESADAVLGLYSDNSDTSGSAISLKEIEQGRLTDHWAIFRGTSSAGSNLTFTYGSNKDYTANPTVMSLTPNSGDGSVILPANAISAGEIFDELGLARTYVNDFNEITQTTSPVTIATSVIDCPTSGFILAMADVRLFNLVGGRADTVLQLIRGTRYEVVDQAVIGDVGENLVIQTVFLASAGENTITLKLSQPDTDRLISWSTPSVTLLFVPTKYGNVDTARLIK